MKLGRTTKFGRIFWCLRLIHHSRYPFSSLHGSTRLTYPYPHRSRLSFLFSPIDHLRLNPSSKFLSIRSCALRVLYVFLPFILPPRLLLRHPLSRLFRFLMAFYSLPFGVSCCVPHCRFDSWLYLSRCYVTVGWRSQQNFTLYCSVVRLGQSPASVLLLSFLQPFEPRHPSLSIGYRLRLRSCQCLHGFAIVFPLFQYRIPAV